MSKGTVAKRLLAFKRSHVDKMGQYLHMKGYYLVIVNAPIHIFDNRTKHSMFPGYRYAYLPFYYSDFNPIKQFSRKGNIDDTDQ